MDGEDLNRRFDKDGTTEVTLVKKVLGRNRYAFFIDFHEDWEGKGFYKYKARRGGAELGPRIIDEVRKIGEIDVKTSESDAQISDGVLAIETSWGTQGLSSYAYEHHTDHVVITETPTRWPLEDRVAAHLAAMGHGRPTTTFRGKREAIEPEDSGWAEALHETH